MALKSIFFSFTLLASFSVVPTHAAIKNVCDDMMASGKSTDEQVAKCVAKFGESDTYKENIQKKKWQQDVDRAKNAEAAARKGNIEAKKFTSKDLSDAAFGKSFYAYRIDYSNIRKPKEKRITDGDSLCSYLGYDKALKSVVSEEILPTEANGNGFIIDTNIFGGVKKEPELYVDKDEKYTTRRYKEITCAKVISKDVDGTLEELRKAVEDVAIIPGNDDLNPPKLEKVKSVNDGPRKPAEDGKTPNGYKRPEWITEPRNSSK